jgi:methyl coenzyme M reductase subunit D
MFPTKRLTAIGGLFGLNPSSIHRKALQADLNASLALVAQTTDTIPPTTTADIGNMDTGPLHTEPSMADGVDADADADDDDDSLSHVAPKIPHFEISIRTFAFTRQKKTTTTQALAIDCAEDDEATLQPLFEAVDDQGLMPVHSYFFPRGVEIADEEYHNLLTTQKSLITNSVVIPVMGLSQKALNSYITNANGIKTKLLYEILRQESIDRIEPTKNIGKWFIISNLQQSKEASRFIDSDLPQYFKQIKDHTNVKVPGWDAPIRSKRHGETPHSSKLVEKLRSRFATAPTIDETVRRTYRKPLATTIKYSSGGLSFAQVAAAAGEESPVANTPEGKKRRKEPTLSEPVILSNPAADITGELRNTIKQLTELMITIRQEVEGKITALTIQVQQLALQSQVTTGSMNQRTEQSTEQDTQQHMAQTLERTVHCAVAAAVGKITTDIADITSLLKDRDARIADEIQGLRDELSEVSQQARTHTTENTSYHTPQTTPRPQHQYGKKDYSPYRKHK